MNTWLPYEDFEKSVECLTDNHLRMQVTDCAKILYWRTGMPIDGRNASRQQMLHPCVVQWDGYLSYLLDYSLEAMTQAQERTYYGTKKEEINKRVEQILFIVPTVESRLDNSEKPHWLGDKDYHDSHKSNLMRVNSFYKEYWITEVNEGLEYVWPSGRKKPLV